MPSSTKDLAAIETDPVPPTFGRIVGYSTLPARSVSAKLRPPVRGRLSGISARADGERADSEGRLTRGGDVMLTTFTGRQTKMAAGLAVRPVAEIAKSSREIVTGDVARKSQAVMTSARTKWSRMTLGIWSSSK